MQSNRRLNLKYPRGCHAIERGKHTYSYIRMLTMIDVLIFFYE